MRWHDRPTGALADRSMPGARWFPGGTLSYAEHALAGRPDAVAVVSLSQTRDRIALTYERTRRAGPIAVPPGCAGWASSAATGWSAYCRTSPRRSSPSSPRPASARSGRRAHPSSARPRSSIAGASWSRPILLTIDGYRYGDRVVSCADKIAALLADLPSIRHVVAIDYLGVPDAGQGDPATAHQSVITWGDLCTPDADGDGPLTFAPVPFDHPLYVLFSSGTTGLPKAIVHSHGGMTVEHLKALRLHHDIGPSDVFMWFTTTGWMMWNYLVSGLLTGATIVLFDGDPGHPDLNTLWSIAAAERVTVLGLGAPFIMGCRADGHRAGTRFRARRAPAGRLDRVALAA